MIGVTDPTPAPPLEGRGAASASLCRWNSVGTPLPSRGGAGVGSVTYYIHNCTNLLFNYH